MDIVTNPFTHSMLGGATRAGFGGLQADPSLTHTDLMRHAQLNTEISRICAMTGVSRAAARPFAENAQKLIDDAVIEVGAQQLAFVTALLANNLRKSLPQWLGVPLLQVDAISEHGQAVETMKLNIQLLGSRAQRTPQSIPVFAYMEAFEYDIREGAVADRTGSGIETNNVAMAVKNVNAAGEQQSINGSTTTTAGGAPGLLNAPNAGSFVFTGGFAWSDTANHLPEFKKLDVLKGVKVLDANRRRGQLMLVINSADNIVLNEDYDTNNRNQGTIRDALTRMEFGSPAAPLEIVVSDAMPVDRISLLEKSTDVLDVVFGQAPTAIIWTPEPGFTTHGVIVGCFPVRTKTDAGGNSGIANGAKT